jgi:hypothetical protein
MSFRDRVQRAAAYALSTVGGTFRAYTLPRPVGRILRYCSLRLSQTLPTDALGRDEVSGLTDHR